ncbi:MAG TPA: flagellar export chaperone FliS [Bryobacteraceae bacterium]|nr:flagellar export chaperone FliS [Bryobacteraceae bacterium]
MWRNAHDAYLEERILSADPLELVRVLYQAATRAVRKARGHLAAGEIAERARAISQAYRVLSELNRSLDHERGGDLSRRLARMYGYMMRRLIEANSQQSDEPLAEVLGLLATLAEGWDALKLSAEAPPEMPKASPWAQAAQEEMSYSSHGWSF